MKLQKQAFRHDPTNGVFGDCHRTAIACILGIDRDTVPNFGVHFANAPAFLAAVDDYLKPLGMCEAHTAFTGELPAVLEWMRDVNPNAAWILAGQSPRGVNHSVICKGGQIVHDPSLDGGDVVGPCGDGFYWVSFLAVRAS